MVSGTSEELSPGLHLLIRFGRSVGKTASKEVTITDCGYMIGEVLNIAGLHKGKGIRSQ